MDAAEMVHGQDRMETPACLCGAVTADRRLAARDDVTGASFTYLHCPACDLERLSPRPPIEDMARFYPDEYVPYNDPPPDPASRGERIKRLVYETFYATPEECAPAVRRWRWALRRLLAPVRQHGVLAFAPPAVRTVFEYGAGTGNDLLAFRHAGWEVSGCEPSAQARAVARRRGIELRPCTAEAADPPDGVGCIYMNNVFEHRHDPRAVLAKSLARLQPGGLLVLVVPNHRAWSARLFGAAWPGYDPPKHIWGFTPRAIRLVLERAGFELLSIDQRYPFSNHCWWAAISGVRLAQPRLPGLRLRLANALRRLLVPVGMLAAFAGHADYIKVVARKPQSAVATR
jgi:SAM-dependent methyltransferase